MSSSVFLDILFPIYYSCLIYFVFNPGRETGLKDDMSHEIPRLTVVVNEFDSNKMQEKHKCDTGRSSMLGNYIKTLNKLLAIICHYQIVNDFRYRSSKTGIQ